MGLFPILLASLLMPHRDGQRSEGLEDPESARRGVEPPTENEEQQGRDSGPDDDTPDDDESIQDPDEQDATQDERDELPPPTRRVTFGAALSGESSPPPEKDSTKPRLFSRLKSLVFPPHEENEPLSNHRILPVVSGLVIPFSILLEIPGLTDSWYIRTDDNVIVESLPNPPSLEVLLAISMFVAVVANVSLICRFLEKGTVLAMTLITIGSLTIHGNTSLRNFIFSWTSRYLDLVNIIALVVFGIQHRFDDGFTYGHAYWMTGTFVAPESFIVLTDGFSVLH